MKRERLFFESTPIVSERRSGIGHALLEMLRELDKDDYVDRYEIIAFVPFGEGKALGRFHFKNIIVKQLPFPHKILSALTRLRYTPPIDIFLGRGTYIFPNYRNFNLLFSTSITFIYDVNYFLHPEYTQPKNLRYLQKNMSKWVARSDTFVTSSEQSKKEVIECLGIDADNIHIVKLGVDSQLFYRRGEEEVKNIREKYSLPNKYFLYVGSIEPRKNLAFMINAYASCDELKQYGLFLVGGDGWLNEGIYEEIDRAKRREYTVMKNDRYVPDEDLPALMSGAAGVLLPSHHEGFGLSVIQANACEVPVVASDIPVLREVGGGELYYFENSDRQSFCKVMLEVLHNPRETKKLDYTWKHTITELERVIGGQK